MLAEKEVGSMDLGRQQVMGHWSLVSQYSVVGQVVIDQCTFEIVSIEEGTFNFWEMTGHIKSP